MCGWSPAAATPSGFIRQARTDLTLCDEAFRSGPLYPIAVTLFYYDQRIRREEYDIERMMETAGLNLSSAPADLDDVSLAPVVEESAD